MDYCERSSTSNAQGEWFGYFHYETLFKINTIRCDLIVFYLVLLFSLLIIGAIFFFWRSLQRGSCKQLHPAYIYWRIRQLSKNSLVDYLTDSAHWRVTLYVFSCLGILFGLPNLILSPEIHSSTNDGWSLRLHIYELPLSLCYTIAEIFLLTAIGSQVETLLFTSTPIRNRILTREQRKTVMRFNLRRSFLVVGLCASLPLSMFMISLVGNVSLKVFSKMIEISWSFWELCVGYFIISKLRFFTQEKVVLKILTKSQKLDDRMLLLQKFLLDYGPKTLVRNFQSLSDFKTQEDLLKLCQIQLRLLEERLELLKEDASVPIPRAAPGIVLIAPKIYMFLQLAGTLLRRTLTLGYFFEASNIISLCCITISTVLSLLVIPVFALVILNSKILLGEERKEEIRESEEYGEDEDQQISDDGRDLTRGLLKL